MPYRGRYALIPAGQGGIMADQNATRYRPQDLLPESPDVSGAPVVTQGVVQVDGVWRKEPGATMLDTSGVAGAPVMGITLGSSQVWAAALVGYTLTSGTPTITNLVAQSTITGAILSQVVGTTIAAGEIVVVMVTTRPGGGGGGGGGTPNIVAIADSKNNTWVLDASTQFDTNDWTYVYRSTITHPLTATDNIAVQSTWQEIAMLGMRVTDTGAKQDDATAHATGTAVSVATNPATTLPMVLVGALYNGGGAAVTATPITGFTQANRINVNGAGSPATWALGQFYQIYTGTTPLTITGLHHWRPTGTAADWAVVTSTTGGLVYKSNADGSNLDAFTLISGLSTTARPVRFVTGGRETLGNDRKLFIFNGANPVSFVSGTANVANPIGTPPADWATYTAYPPNGMIHRNRLVACARHTLYFSEATDHGDFTPTLIVQAEPSIGDTLYGLGQYLGLLWWFKHPVGIGWVDDADADSTNWTSQMLTDAIGCAPSPYAALPMGNDVMFLSADGQFYLLSAVRESGGVAHTVPLSTQLHIDQWLRETLTLGSLSQAVSVWYPHKKQAIWGLPANGSTTNTLRLIFDFEPAERGGAPIVTPSYRDVTDGLCLYMESDKVERPLLGEAGFVSVLERDARSKGGAGYAMAYCTPHLDLRHDAPENAGRKKQFDHVTIQQNPNPSGSANTYSLHVFIDRAWARTVTLSTSARRVRTPINASGFEIALAVENSAANEDVAIIEHLIGYRQLDEGAI